MKTKKEVETGDGYSLSLLKLLPGKVAIKDVAGYVTNEFGEPLFKLVYIELTNGEKIFVEGEHDLPYLATSQTLSNEQLKSLYDEDLKPK